MVFRSRLLAAPVLLLALLLLLAVVAPAAHGSGGTASSALPPEDVGHKSIAIYVGHELTDDGSALLLGTGHEPSSHWLEIVPRQEHPEGATVTVGVTDEAWLPGERSEIPQAPVTNKYITSNYSEFAGFPPPLTNGGLNEHGVAARDVWSPSRQELVDMTPEDQTGPNYSDLARAAMERASTAREAVEVVGGLINEHGYSTYGGNSHLFADHGEAWVLIEYAGGQGLWGAQRFGSDEIRVSWPEGYLDEFPLDYDSHPDFMASDNFIDFAVDQGWWDLDAHDTFDPQAAYSRDADPPARGLQVTDEFEDMVPVSLEDALAYMRDPRWIDDRAGYGHVAHLRPDVDEDLHVLWASVTGAIAAPLVPIHIGADDVPPEFKQHRYMTKDADSAFLDADYAPLEATRYATRVFKRLLYHTCENPETFLRPVTAELEAYERLLLDELATVETEAQALLDAGDVEGARAHLTEHAQARLLGGLDLGEALVNVVEAETRERFGIRMPSREVPEGETMRPESMQMTGPSVNCHEDGIDDYPRAHGSYDDLAGDLLPPDERGGPPFDPPGPPDERPPHGNSAESAAAPVQLAGTSAVYVLGALSGVLLMRIRSRRERSEGVPF